MSALEITTHIGCSNACSYCPQNKLVKAYSAKNADRTMSFQVFKECINKVPVSVNVHFSGMCDPWLNPACSRMLLYAYDKGHKLSVYTGLAGITESDLDLFENINFRDFSVHLPSLESCMNFEVNADYLNRVSRLASGRMKNLFFRAHGNELLPSIQSIMNKMKRQVDWFPLTTRAGNIQLDGVAHYTKRRKTIGCVRHFRQNILLPNGDVLLCCADYGMQHVLGNLLVSGYDNLFTSEEFLKVKRGVWCEASDILCKYCDGYTYETFPGRILYLVSNKITKFCCSYLH